MPDSDNPLVFVNNELQEGGKGLHALIVGVSHYPHLPDGGGTPAEKSYGMGQLSSTSLTAYKMYRWLLENKDLLPVPLATIRLLLSPSEGELKIEPSIQELLQSNKAKLSTKDNFVLEAKAWRSDARTSEDNVTFFYFAGHGVQRKKDDAVMLLRDFGYPAIGGSLANAAAMENLFYGMAPPQDTTKTIA